MSDWNTPIIEEFRANDGKVGGPFEGSPLLLLHTRGARSGEERVNPVMYLDHSGRRFVFASFAGKDVHPAWYHNLVAHPTVTVELGTERYEATAVPVPAPEREQIYSEQVTRYPQFGEYQQKTRRVIPVVELVPGS
ncbi:MAG TPA: nitroreductase family deazaflavin-dependent oxidoreductase [Acidimicrobiales bacterium]|nr:nitroreductase family deazaflavin-dependent oxidoreductase [Acidimicrobiales bacterium]